jgi:hypothetical protein
MDEKFETEDVEVEEYGGKRRTGSTVIKWKVDWELRSWGIKSLYAHVPNQTIEIEWKDEDADGDEITVVESEEITSCYVSDFADCKLSGDIFPTSLDIDRDKKTFTLVF